MYDLFGMCMSYVFEFEIILFCTSNSMCLSPLHTPDISAIQRSWTIATH